MSDRRPIQARNTKWASSMARLLKNIGFTPNVISVWSMVFALCAGASFYWSQTKGWSALLLGAILVQMRLLCNLFDGMVAIEHGLKSKSGEIFNDFPDRPADIFILIGLGYAAAPLPHAIELGWLAACLAVLTAYVRVLGKSTGTQSYFIGPMAKQHRMATVTIAAILGIFENKIFGSSWVLWVALILISIGSLVAVLRRLSYITRELEAKP